jgi:hypothetical protein
MATIGFMPPLYDLGHVGVVWDTNLQAPVQDPTAVGAGNVYGTADVFTDASGANLYRVAIPSGQVIPAGQATPPSQQQQQPPGNQVTTTGRPSNAAFGPAGSPQTIAGLQVAGSPMAWLQQTQRVLGVPMPGWMVAGLVGVGAYAFTQRKRR